METQTENLGTLEEMQDQARAKRIADIKRLMVCIKKKNGKKARQLADELNLLDPPPTPQEIKDREELIHNRKISTDMWDVYQKTFGQKT